MKRFVACYDISSDKDRLKVMRSFKREGFHSQLSFFELEAHSAQAVSEKVKGFLSGTDRLAVVRLSKRGKIKRIGSFFEGTEWVL
ncbi:MAG: CRISPR-associated endonuclease Cas2 [Hydrogenobacter thermophilus]|uniref:CRISPR-associated endonuclease Cas2 n=1 Tax=Hydrogenobacter thermophilus TaxID=940 RepID=UPI001C773960|nr:CRISPR-associated endonuclease Cas2 [Hydrogenobacter thermophilus]QWK20615.1 MAG: CRISPR-associated endonuclease Cas2 [Hydrogenobacter thermophilus]